MSKQWNILFDENDISLKKAAALLREELGISETVAKLLCNRGYRETRSASDFISNRESILDDPFLMKDMDAATERINRAVDGKEKIVIFGDYDVDGITAVTVLYLYLRKKGADVGYYVPNRFTDGYGIPVNFIADAAVKKTNLIITVDTGVTAIDEAAEAERLGIDMVITDHHECKDELPRACAVVNPHRKDCSYPYKMFAGVGVVFKILCGCEIKRERAKGGRDIDAVREICREYLDLVALGTIADIMPLTGENRLIVSLGLAMLSNAKRCGLAALETCIESGRPSGKTRTYGKGAERRKKINSTYAGFQIAPRLNAAGRMASADIAVELLLSESVEEAMPIAKKLCELNRERQNEEDKIVEEVKNRIAKDPKEALPNVMVLASDEWSQGIIGIVSSRITRTFGKPSVLITFSGGAGTGKGSGRSIGNFSLIDALSRCSPLLEKFGGHELAAGLTLKRENLRAFTEKINEVSAEMLGGREMKPSVDIDCGVKLSELTIDFAESLELLEPYGYANPQPLFAAYGLEVLRVSPVGVKGNHTKILLSDGRDTVSVLFFNKFPSECGVVEGEYADMVFGVSENIFQGIKSVQLVIEDIRVVNARRYDEVESGVRFGGSDDFIPERNDFVLVYRILSDGYGKGTKSLGDRDLLARCKTQPAGRGMNYVKMKYILRILTELGICDIDYGEKDSEGNGIFTFSMERPKEKKDINDSKILKKLKSGLGRENG